MVSTQIDFWSNHPCGADGDLNRVIEFRNRMVPWHYHELRTIPSGLGKYLEIGCGQGLDSFYICSLLNKSDHYIAIDYSTDSIELAVEHVDEAKKVFNLKITPTFSQGDALGLIFGDTEFDFIYSHGALHHTPNPQLAINEVFRVLKPGGRAKIFLYRRYSLKVGIAKFLRQLQRLADKILSQDRCIYNLLNNKKSDFFGTMFLECFGVPWMEWYSEKELRTMFGKFGSIDITPYDFNLAGLLRKKIDGYNRFGYLYKIDVTK